MGTVISKTCANCGRTFYTRDENKIYCDVKCEEYANDGLHVDYVPKEIKETPTKACLWCGRVFAKKENEAENVFNNKKCCCSSCGQKLRAKLAKEGRL